MTEIKFIGTSSGFAEKGRFHFQIYFKNKSGNVLFDAPDGGVHALLAADEKINEISAIVISHFHPDHVSGLASLLQQMKLTRRTAPLKIFVHEKTKRALLKLLALTYIFPDTFPFDFELVAFREKRATPIFENFLFFAYENAHVRDKYGKASDEVKFVSSSFLFEIDGKKIAVTADVANGEEFFLFPVSRVDCFVAEWTHAEFSAFAKVVERYKPEKLIITHYHSEKIAAFEPRDKITLAKDGAVFKV